MGNTLTIARRPEVFVSDDKRVIPRDLNIRHGPRVRSIFRRIMRIPESRIPGLLESVMNDFAMRHRDINRVFMSAYEEAAGHLYRLPELSEQRKLLVGSYFTMEYSIESAALFNPSIVMHPDQADVDEGDLRFLISLRATGEGHVSSIVFRRGIISSTGELTLDPPPRYAYTARPAPDPTIEKSLIVRKLHEKLAGDELTTSVLDDLPDPFTLSQLTGALAGKLRGGDSAPAVRNLARQMLWIARANYSLQFPPDCQPAEIVIFPATPFEQHGMEDLRLVRFVDDDGRVLYLGTYTAYDGQRIHPMMLETSDFQSFHVSTLSGRFARNKGMAMFPRRIDGHYVMLGRHDGENNYLLRSHNLYVWNQSQRLQGPKEPWELVQVGNCGSPLETEAGWIVLTHGVGPVRKYCIGAILLDLRDPSRVIGRLRDPLLTPKEEEREGYVPNVVYSCGSMILGDQLVVPYALSDTKTVFGTLSVSELVDRLIALGP